MEEDSQIAKERKQLRGMREKLEIAIDSIQKLEVPFANDDMTETSTHMSTHTTDVDMGEEEELEEEDGTAWDVGMHHFAQQTSVDLAMYQGCRDVIID